MTATIADITISDPADATRQATVAGVQIERVTWSTNQPGQFVGTAPVAALEAAGYPLRDIPRSRLSFVHESGEPWAGEVTRLSGHSDRGVTIEARADIMTPAQVSHA